MPHKSRSYNYSPLPRNGRKACVRAKIGLAFLRWQSYRHKTLLLCEIPCSSIETEDCAPDTSQFTPCSDLRKLLSFTQQNEKIGENGAQFRGQKIDNSLYISLLAGEFRRRKVSARLCAPPKSCPNAQEFQHLVGRAPKGGSFLPNLPPERQEG